MSANARKPALARIRQAATIGLGITVLAGSSQAFWFVCSYRDSAKAAEAANAARAAYFDCLSSSTATAAQTEAKRQAWKFLVGKTLGDLKQFATSVPGTSFTGPPSVKGMAKEAVKEAIKEALGELVGESEQGTPAGGLGMGAPDHGEIVANPMFAGIPVLDFPAEAITSLDLSYLSPADYDGSVGLPPIHWDLESPLVMIEMTFSDVPFDAFPVFAPSPELDAFGGTLVTPGSIAADLALDPFLGEHVFGRGLVPEELLAWIAGESFGWDPLHWVSPGMRQVSMLTITEVDAEAGTLSGTAFGIAGSSNFGAVSIAAGGEVALDVNGGPEMAGAPFLIVGSLSGTAPGLPLGGTVLPLNYDAYMDYTLSAPGAPPILGGVGLLDPLGRAHPTFVLPPAAPPALAGLELHHAALALNPTTLELWSGPAMTVQVED